MVQSENLNERKYKRAQEGPRNIFKSSMSLETEGSAAKVL